MPRCCLVLFSKRIGYWDWVEIQLLSANFQKKMASFRWIIYSYLLLGSIFIGRWCAVQSRKVHRCDKGKVVHRLASPRFCCSALKSTENVSARSQRDSCGLFRVLSASIPSQWKIASGDGTFGVVVFMHELPCTTDIHALRLLLQNKLGSGVGARGEGR